MIQEATGGSPSAQKLPGGNPAAGKLVKRASRLISGTAVFCIVIFGIAGRVNWLEAWAFTAFFFFFHSFVLIWGTRNAPELLDERGATAANVKSWDKTIMKICRFLLIVLMPAKCKIEVY